MKALLVIPCYCESKRLPKFLPKLCDLIEDFPAPIVIQLVDDGSPPEEQRFLAELAQSLREKYPFLRSPLLLKKNLGKGGAIKAGWDKGADFDFLSFVDADGAASAEETVRFLNILQQSGSTREIQIATRDPLAGRELHRALSRKIVARFFNFVIRKRYDIHVSDTQCGLKAIPGEFYRSVRSHLKQEGYAFDLEILLFAKRNGIGIETVPINWSEISGSSTSLKHALFFLRQILTRSI